MMWPGVILMFTIVWLVGLLAPPAVIRAAYLVLCAVVGAAFGSLLF